MNQLQTMEPEAAGQRALFDYSALDAETRIVVQQRTSEIQMISKHVATELVEIGGKLAEVKERLKNGARFKSWLDAEFPRWSERTAHNLIYAWKEYHDADFAIDGIAPSALYILSAPSTPKAAREMAKQIVESGVEVSHATAQEVVRQAKARRPRQEGLIEEPGEEVEEVGADGAVDPSAICLCGCKAGDHTREDGEFAECTECECEVFQEATEAEIAERKADEKALGISDSAPAAEEPRRPMEQLVATVKRFSGRIVGSTLVNQGFTFGQVAEALDRKLIEKRNSSYLWYVEPVPAPESLTAPKSAAMPSAVKAPATPERPAAWFKNRIEIVITLLPGAEPRKIMHSVRAGDTPADIPFVAVSSGEAELLDVLPPITRGLFEKAYEAFAKKPAAKPPTKKPTVKSKPPVKKPAAKTKAKGGKK